MLGCRGYVGLIEEIVGEIEDPVVTDLIGSADLLIESFETDRVDQLRLAVRTAGSSLDQVLKCTVYCTSVDYFPVVNGIYARYFPVDPPARVFMTVPAWPGPFDIEIDAIATL